MDFETSTSKIPLSSSSSRLGPLEFAEWAPGKWVCRFYLNGQRTVRFFGSSKDEVLGLILTAWLSRIVRKVGLL